ncbi:MAG: hypothetical protein HRF45_01060 [Fimbriimonadia bacterium]|jgi:hypothetical protein
MHYNRRMVAGAIALALVLVLVATSLDAQVMRGSRMTVIAPSTATRDVARQVMRQSGWSEAKPKQADGVLVVVRSSMHDPLFTSSRSCFCDLRKNAERQPNLSGSKYHIYVYRLNDDLTVTEVKHTTRDAK